MKNKFWLALACFLTQVSCNIADITPVNNTITIPHYQTARAFKEMNFHAYARPLVFGPSVGDSGGGPNCSIVLGGYLDVPEDAVELRSVTGSGKIAGSEDGIAYYFKEVDAAKNFRIEAEFLVIEYGNNATDGGRTDTTLAADGQNGFGIMARDFIPQWPGATMQEIEDRRNSGALGLGVRDSAGYYTGNRGGDSNMIMVGGVKYGAPKVAWRYGVKWNGNPVLTDGEYTDLTSGNPGRNEYQDAGKSKFNYLPKELGDYSLYTEAIAARPDYPEWGRSRYRFKLEKNNNGFNYEYEFLPDETLPDWRNHPSNNKGTLYRNDAGEDEIRTKESGAVPLYDILNSINKKKYYVGFFASRNARVWIRNVKYAEAAAAECAPYVEPLPDVIDPALEILSPMYYTGSDYIYARSNVTGQLIVTQDGKQIPFEVINNEWIVEKTNASAVPHTLFTIPILPITRDGDTVFSLTFYPRKNLAEEVIALGGDAGAVLKSYAPLNRTFVLTRKVYNNGAGTIWAAPAPQGSPDNDGSEKRPLDLQKAVDCVQPGQTIKLKNGTYVMDTLFVIPRYNSGRFGAEKKLIAEDRDGVFIDWNKNRFLANKGQGFLLAGNYWTLEGFHIRNTPDKTKGMVISGNNNTIRWVQFYNNGDTGMQISGNSTEAKRFWPANNLVQYCESFNNRDGAAKDADGFAAKLTAGRDNRFEWCIAHNNVDDGWDMFTKKETGAIGAITLYACISYEAGIILDGNNAYPNGRPFGPNYTENGVPRPLATRNGFKMGGEGIAVRHEISECLAFGCDGNAIMSNSNPSLKVTKSTAIGYGGKSTAAIVISAGDRNTPIDGRVSYSVGSVSPAANGIGNGGGVESFDVETILHERVIDGSPYSVNGVVYSKFLKRDENGKPLLGNVYKPDDPSRGAWEFFYR